MQVGPGIVEKLKSDPVALKQALVGFAAFESVLAVTLLPAGGAQQTECGCDRHLRWLSSP
ncbi:MAG: hypothetical protein U0105_10530 [Candidatus Obscuribacterales bacterium]